MSEIGQLSSAQLRDRISHYGFAIIDDAMAPAFVTRLREAIAAIPAGEEVRRKANVYGIRNLLEVCAEVRALAKSPEIRAIAEPVLGEGCFAVRATFFDKVPDANWNLRWHQDSVISVKQRIETEGYHAWADKAGVTQVRPPESVLSQMLAIRIHLDDCHRDNGALRVLSGSHHQRWSREEISDCKKRFEELTCEVKQRGILAMRPLLLHASSASETPSHRRVIHIEFANMALPNGLAWNNRIEPLAEEPNSTITG